MQGRSKAEVHMAGMARRSVRERERACVRERSGRGGGGTRCMAGMASLESCGLISLVELESRELTLAKV